MHGTPYFLPDTITAILFDKDGTLIDFESTWAPVNRAAARIAASGDANLQQRILAACGVDPQTGRTTGDSLFAAGNASEIAARMVAEGSLIGHAELTRALDDLFASAAGTVVPVVPLPGLFSGLHELGFRVGIASSDNERSIRLTAASLGIAGFVDFYCGYDTGHGSKPGPGMVHAFCGHIGCAPANVAVVGDNRHDMEMGRAAGAGATIGVLSGTGSRDTLAALADTCIENVAALHGLIRRVAPLR